MPRPQDKALRKGRLADLVFFLQESCRRTMKREAEKLEFLRRVKEYRGRLKAPEKHRIRMFRQ